MMETRVFGKWILTGEHAVIRGAPALVFPVFGKALSLRYEDHGGEIEVEFSGDHGSEMQLLFWGVIEKALHLIDAKHAVTRAQIRGRFQIDNEIPVGAGLGASAALCVGVGRWIHWKGWVEEAELLEFCRQLENLFHGESSGLDVAVALSGQGLHYERAGTRRKIEPRWKPQWFLSYSGKRGVTSECVAKVKALAAQDPKLGARLDLEMTEASVMAEEALELNEGPGFKLLATAIQRARHCFEEWGLTSGEMGAHLEWLESHGAVAVKPTGSGDGGFVLSLWASPPPAELHSALIALSR